MLIRAPTLCGKRAAAAHKVPSVGVKEGLSCVISRAIVAQKTPNLALPSLQHSVQGELLKEEPSDYPKLQEERLDHGERRRKDGGRERGM